MQGHSGDEVFWAERWLHSSVGYIQFCGDSYDDVAESWFFDGGTEAKECVDSMGCFIPAFDIFGIGCILVLTPRNEEGKIRPYVAGTLVNELYQSTYGHWYTMMKTNGQALTSYGPCFLVSILLLQCLPRVKTRQTRSQEFTREFKI